MKKFNFLPYQLITYCLLLIFVCSLHTSNAAIWRVNNNAGVSAHFTTVDAAITAAAAFDTIYIEPSATFYTMGTVANTKYITYIGNGYFLSGANGNIGLQYNTQTSRIAALGSGYRFGRFIGLVFAGSVFVKERSTDVTLETLITDSIYFEKCQFEAGLQSVSPGGLISTRSIRNITIIKSFFNATAQPISLTTVPTFNIRFENNIVNWGLSNVPLNLGHSTTNNQLIVRNNTFISAGGGFGLGMGPGCYFVNNIISSTTNNGSVNCSTVVMRNNLFLTNSAFTFCGTGNTGNVFLAANTNYNAVFTASNPSSDGRFQLTATSPARGMGRTVGSVVNPDVGAFGGPDPYVLSGIPNIPTIYSLTVPASVIQGQPLNINVGTRSNK